MPNRVKGSSTRAMGRDRKLASPVKLTVTCVVATAPIIRREPVPELPKSSADGGARHPPKPTPVTRHIPSLSRLTAAPREATAPALFSTSSDSRRPVIRLSPSAIPARIRARWEMDLSPGTQAVPLRDGALPARSGWLFGASGSGGMGRLRLTFTGGAESGKRAPPNTLLHGNKNLGQGGSWNEAGLPQLRGALLRSFEAADRMPQMRVLVRARGALQAAPRPPAGDGCPRDGSAGIRGRRGRGRE